MMRTSTVRGALAVELSERMLGKRIFALELSPRLAG